MGDRREIGTMYVFEEDTWFMMFLVVILLTGMQQACNDHFTELQTLFRKSSAGDPTYRKALSRLT